MLLRQQVSININNTPAAIWDVAHDPKNWTASNPEEHFGLKFNSPDNRPDTGIAFEQKESVGGFYAVLKGIIMYAKRPHVLVWTGIATYPLGPFKFRLPEGGLVRLTKQQTGTQLSHHVFMHFPDSLAGVLIRTAFTKVFHGEKALYDHTFKELAFFKRQLE